MATTKWVLDPTHSEVNFKIKHLMITNVTGSITDFSVEAETESDDFAHVKVNFKGQLASLTTQNEQRDLHLKGEDFFDIANYPEISFESTQTGPKSADGNFVLIGNLTIKNTTELVQLNVEFGGIAKDPWGNTKAGFKAKGKINRKDYKLMWSVLTEAGGMVVSDEVEIVINLELAQAK